MEIKQRQYGWTIALAGMLGVFACIGLGRLTIGMLLPPMSEALGLDYGQMGQLSASNFVGYLGAVVLAGAVVKRFGYNRSIFFSLLMVSVFVFLISQADSYFIILLCYTATGVFSGVANVSIMAMVASWYASRQRGKAVGFAVIGNGFAMMLSGQFFPRLNQVYGHSGWRISWLVIGSLVLIVAVISAIIIRNAMKRNPEKLSLNPQSSTSNSSMKKWQKPITSEVSKLAAIYFLFGFTHVIYLTFIVTTLIRDHDFPESLAGNFWALVGLISLISGPLFGYVSDRSNRKIAMGLVFLIQAISYFLVASDLPQSFLIVSVGLFGIVCWAIPSIMAALITDIVGPEQTAKYYGYITFAFSIGQIIGPVTAGYLAEITTRFSTGYYLTTGLAIMSVLVVLSVRKSSSI